MRGHMVVELLPKQPQAPVRFIRRTARGISVAVVGCGYWGSKHVRVLSSLPEVSRIIVVDPDPRACAAIAAAFPNVEIAGDLTSVLDLVDAVIVATPPK